MKLTFVGTGTMGTLDRGTTSILVDDILFDAGCGTTKQLDILGLYTKPIKYIVISHFHADHFLDLGIMLNRRVIRKENEDFKLTIIGPVGIRQKVIDLMVFTHGDGNPNKYDNIDTRHNIDFVELEDGEKYTNDSFSITALSLKHGTCNPIYGYILEKENHTISYATDTTLCDNFYKMCECSEITFADANRPTPMPMHMGLDELIEISEKYPNCKFYAIHRNDYEVPQDTKVLFPMDGDIIEL